MSGQIDAGWSAPPYAMEALRKNEIRVIVRSNELALIRGPNAAALAARPDVYRGFMRAYRETVDWMYGGDAPLKMYAEFADISLEDGRRIREEFDPKEMLIPDRVLGIAQLMPEAMKFKFISQPLTEEQLKELVQVWQ